ncbi:terminase gpA endonuclease subunit [Muricauda sp. MAR_2010_75]|uniref:terminase gpA endonuclease subunit n=1 Tax=Allomuricauda sp. MAR_2010_75 TaxID=1250232 RepID=UPI00056549ED|nr:terminase gpA endonuclease subunit [Muricauda sp. MAR_2010_75]
MFQVHTTTIQQAYHGIHEKIFDFRVEKPLPSDWTEANVKLGSDVSRYVGPFSYDRSPYTREIIDNLSPTNPVETVAVMKCAQSGLTQGVIIPGICYIISETPAPILFMAGDKELGKNSIETRLDPIIESAGISHLIRPNVVRKRNQRTGDTSTGKEFAGGQLIMQGTKNADKMRQFSVKYIFADDWEAAPRDDKKEGSTQKLVEGRATSYGNTSKKFYISTPAVEQTSNIEPIYNQGDQRKWHWQCPHCEGWIAVEWRVKRDDKTYGGIKYELDDSGSLKEDSVHYECQLCRGKIDQKQKYSLNLKGKWIPTAKPKRPQIRSYYLNALIIPPGFTSWVDLVYEWIDANPQNGVVDTGKLKTFKNIRLGQTWKETGETPRVNELMKNTCQYLPGVVPDLTSEAQGNGPIIMLTLACDLNGIMTDRKEDVRLDWELVAHSKSGATYSVDHGSIGTFKRDRDKTEFERNTDGDREKYTYNHGYLNSVWPIFEKLIRKEWPTESGEGTMSALVTLIDTGYFTRLAFQFIDSIHDRVIFGIKGEGDIKYRSVLKDTPMVKLSREVNTLYLLEVNQLKDELSSYIKLKKGNDDYQPPGFMNFPQPTDGKYTMTSFFQHFEGERRVEEIRDGNVVGFKWEKKNNQSLNHFWDVRVYNLAARYVWLDLFVKSEKNIRSITWAEYVELVS